MKRCGTRCGHGPSPRIVKLALGQEGREADLTFNTWEAILAELIVGDVFGADRIDYLLRDSLHTGVAYGRFDHHRLIQTMRILPAGTGPAGGGASTNGRGGGATRRSAWSAADIESAESLLIARYFMFSQVYFHPTRLIYDST